MDEIINKVAQSSLITIDLDDYVDKSERMTFDLKQTLFQEMILKELDFRKFIKEFNWEIYKGKNVNVICTADAIIPSWAYMLISSRVGEYANIFTFGDEDDLERAILDHAIENLQATQNLDEAKVVIKGCGNIRNRDYAYFKLAQVLVPKVQSLMYGEPCSTVPVFKRPKVK